MAAFVQKARLRDLVKGVSQTSKISPLAIPEDVDAAVFRMSPGSKANPHPLAKENPKKGDAIWLVAALDGQEGREWNSVVGQGLTALGPDELVNQTLIVGLERGRPVHHGGGK